MSFGLFLLGAIIFICGVVWALVAMHVSQQWVIIVAIIMLGIAIFSGVSRTRAKDPS